jgi:hypothetical protein
VGSEVVKVLKGRDLEDMLVTQSETSWMNTTNVEAQQIVPL